MDRTSTACIWESEDVIELVCFVETVSETIVFVHWSSACSSHGCCEAINYIKGEGHLDRIVSGLI